MSEINFTPHQRISPTNDMLQDDIAELKRYMRSRLETLNNVDADLKNRLDGIKSCVQYLTEMLGEVMVRVSKLENDFLLKQKMIMDSAEDVAKYLRRKANGN